MPEGKATLNVTPTDASIDKALNKALEFFNAKKGGSSGGDVNITINQTVNEKSSGNNDDQFRYYGWGRVHESWFGDDDKGNANYKGIDRLVSALDQLSSQMSNYGQTLKEFSDIRKTLDALEKPYSKGTIWNNPSDIKRRAEIAANPYAAIAAQRIKMADALGTIDRTTYRKHRDNASIANIYDNVEYANIYKWQAIKNLRGGDAASAIEDIGSFSAQVESLVNSIERAYSDIAKYDKEDADKLAESQAKNRATREAQKAQEEAVKAKADVAHAQQEAQQARKESAAKDEEIASLKAQLANAQKQAAQKQEQKKQSAKQNEDGSGGGKKGGSKKGKTSTDQDTQAKLDEAQKQAKDSDKARQEAERKAAQAEKRAQNAEKKVANLEQKNVEAQKQASENKQKDKDLSKQNSDLQKENARLKKQVEQAEKKAEKAETKFNQEKQKAETAKKEAADAKKSEQAAQNDLQESQRNAGKLQEQIDKKNKANDEHKQLMSGVVGGGRGPGGGSGGGGDDVPPGGEIRYFESLEQLKTFLNSLNLGDVGREIQGIFNSLGDNGGAIEKTITGLFGANGILRGINISGADKKYGSGEQVRAQYRFDANVGDDGNIEYSTLYNNIATMANKSKLDSFQREYERQRLALVNKMKAMYELPVMQGDPNKNELLKQWMQIATVDDAGKIDLINVEDVNALQEAKSAVKDLEISVGALNKQMQKKWASSAVEKMDTYVEDMLSQRKLFINQFRAIGIDETFDSAGRSSLFGDFDKAYQDFQSQAAKDNPQVRVDAYNAMAKAMNAVTRSYREQTSAYRDQHRVQVEQNKAQREQTRLAKENRKVNRISTVTMGQYKNKYNAMNGGSGGLPPEFDAARKAIARYRKAQSADERNAAMREIEENMATMRDDLDVKYPKWRSRQQSNEKLGKQNRRQYRMVPGQNKQAENIRNQVATMAQPYGGMSSPKLPDYLRKVVDAMSRFKGTGDLESRITQMRGLQGLLDTAKRRDKEDKQLVEANDLLSRMSTDSPMVAKQRSDLEAAINQVTGLKDDSSLSDRADAFANLTVQIKAAAEAQKEFEKADANYNNAEQTHDTLEARRASAYEGYVNQVNGLREAYQKMGHTLDTTVIDNMLAAFQTANVDDRGSVTQLQARIGEEIKRMRGQRTIDQDIFRANTKRNNVNDTLNGWMDSLDVDSSKLQKIQELRDALASLNAIGLRAPNGLAEFNQQLSTLSQISDEARAHVEAVQQYQKVRGDKNYGLLGFEHEREDGDRFESTAIKNRLEGAYSAYQADQSEANLKALNAALEQCEARLKEISTIDAFGKLREQAKGLEEQVNAINSKNGDRRKWSPAQLALDQQYQEMRRDYEAQYKGGNLEAAKESFATMQNQVKALNESFESGGALVGVYDGKLSKLASRVLGVGSAFMAVQRVMGTVRKMAGYVTQIDTAMTELRKVTDESAAAYERFQKQSGKTAVAIGSSVADLINTATEYGRMGYSLAESQELGTVTTKFANTGNFQSVNDASDALIAIIRGFDGLDVGDAEAVSDKMTAVANAYAVTASDIAAGLQRSASALNLTGVDLDQATAMITAITEVTRDASSAGNAIRTMSMRIRGAKTE